MTAPSTGEFLNRPWPDSYHVDRCPAGGYMAIDYDRYDGSEDGDGVVGYGATEEAAVEDMEALYRELERCA